MQLWFGSSGGDVVPPLLPCSWIVVGVGTVRRWRHYETVAVVMLQVVVDLQQRRCSRRCAPLPTGNRKSRLQPRSECCRRCDLSVDVLFNSLLQLRVIIAMGGLLVVGGVVCDGFWAVVVVENEVHCGWFAGGWFSDQIYCLARVLGGGGAGADGDGDGGVLCVWLWCGKPFLIYDHIVI